MRKRKRDVNFFGVFIIGETKTIRQELKDYFLLHLKPKYARNSACTFHRTKTVAEAGKKLAERALYYRISLVIYPINLSEVEKDKLWDIVVHHSMVADRMGIPLKPAVQVA